MGCPEFCADYTQKKSKAAHGCFLNYMILILRSIYFSDVLDSVSWCICLLPPPLPLLTTSLYPFQSFDTEVVHYFEEASELEVTTAAHQAQLYFITCWHGKEH